MWIWVITFVFWPLVMRHVEQRRDWQWRKRFYQKHVKITSSQEPSSLELLFTRTFVFLVEYLFLGPRVFVFLKPVHKERLKYSDHFFFCWSKRDYIRKNTSRRRPTLTTHKVGTDSLFFIHLSSRIDHKICMAINRLNHHTIFRDWKLISCLMI